MCLETVVMRHWLHLRISFFFFLQDRNGYFNFIPTFSHLGIPEKKGGFTILRISA